MSLRYPFAAFVVPAVLEMPVIGLAIAAALKPLSELGATEDGVSPSSSDSQSELCVVLVYAGTDVLCENTVGVTDTPPDIAPLNVLPPIDSGFGS